MAISLIDPTPGNDTMSDVYIKINDTIDAVNNITVGATLSATVVDIGDWNMDSTISVSINHGIADYKTIRSVYVIIRDDTDTTYSPLDFSDASGICSGTFSQVVGTQISLNRTASGLYDNTNYDSTSFNRGWIYITYIS